MRLSIKSFDGHNLSDTDYRAVPLNFGTAATVSVSFIDQANADPVYSGLFTGQVRNLAICIHIVNYANRFTLEEQLRSWIRPGVEGNLVVIFTDDNQDYQTSCVVQSFIPMPSYPGKFTIILQAAASTWRRVTASTDNWSASSSNLTKAITVNSKEKTALNLTITPTGAALNGWQYQYLYELVNTPGINYGVRPWCVPLDTAALVTAGKLQADCDDLRVVINGSEVNRWISNPNTAGSKIWFNVNIGLGYSLTLKTAVPASGTVGELQFAITNNNRIALKALPETFILVHGTEWFQCSGKNLALFKVGVTKRGALGTTMQAHIANDVFKYIQNVVYILAGNSTATNPATDDATYDDIKPVFDLVQSDNTQWVYTASTNFYDPLLPNRPGSWSPSETCIGDVSKNYFYAQNGSSGVPAAGALMSCWQKFGRWQNEGGHIFWSLSSPGGISEVSMTGSKYRSTARWPALAGLQRSPDGRGFLMVWNETTPVNLSTWTAINQQAIAIPNNTIVRFIFGGALVALADAAVYFEVLTAVVKFTVAKLPFGTLLGQASNYPLAIRLTNSNNGDAIALVCPMQLNKTLTVNNENFMVTYDGVNAHGTLVLNDESRDTWIRLENGTNTLTISPINDNENIGNLTLDLSWYGRRS